MADYNINAVTRRVVFTGSAGLGPYAFTFEVLNSDDVAVYFNATLLTITTDYTVTINANGTGSVTIVTGGSVPSTPTASDQIVIVGARDIERVTDFVTAGDLLASSLNEQLDALTIFDQQVAEENKRAMRAPVYDPALVEDGGVVDMTLPAKAARAGKYLQFNSTTGNPEAGPDSTDITTLADIATDIATLADIEDGTDATDAIQTVAGISANVTTVAGVSANVTTVAGISSDVTSVAGDATDIGTVATNIANVNTVAGNDANITTVAGISANVTTVAGDSADIQAVAADAADIGTVATNIADVNTAAANITDIQNASTNAATATTKAAEAATSASNAATSETNAATSATAAAASQTAAAASAASAASAYDSFDDRYLGVKASDPTVDNDGDPLSAGLLYFSSSENIMKVYDGASWIAATSAGNVSLILYEYTATSGQTTFSGADDNAATLSYTVNNIQVVMNGIVLDPSDFTATTGTSVVLASGAAANDLVNIYAFKSFTVADTVSASAGGTFSANVTVSGTVTANQLDTDNIRIDGNTISSTDTNGDITLDPDGTGDVIVASGNVGIGTTSPSELLHVDNASGDAAIRIDGSTRSFKIEQNNYGLRFVDVDAGNAERMRLLAGGGLTFNGDTAAANALDDYEEGTWTPGFTTDSGSAASGTVNGRYTKIGRAVYITAHITNIDTTGTTSSSRLRINGLPFTCDQIQTQGTCWFDQITLQGGRTMVTPVFSTSELIEFTQSGSGLGDTPTDHGDINSGVTDIYLSGFYLSDS